MTRLRTLALLLSALSLGCGGGFAPQEGCSVYASVSPALPVVGNVLTGEASSSSAGLTGIRSFTWTVTNANNSAVITIDLASDSSRVEFLANSAGTYTIAVDGWIGPTQCERASTQVTVTPDGATLARYKLRYTPLSSHPAPPQDDSNSIQVFAGQVLLPLNARTLDGGEIVSASVVGPSGALSARLQLRDLAGGRTADVLADQGNYAALLPSSTYDLLVVPYDVNVAPRAFAAQGMTDLAVGYNLDAGDALTGTVRGPGGSPVTGARIAVGTSTLPATVALTQSDGTFTSHFRVTTDPQTLTVIPPAGADWPYLELANTAVLAADSGSSLAIDWPTINAVPLSVAVTMSDTVTALPGAEVVFVARSIVGSGSVTVDGGLPIALVGGLRKRLLADGAGVLPNFSLPRGVYDMVVVPPANVGGQRISVSELDITVASPGSVAAGSAAGVSLDFTVLDAQSNAVVGARIVAVGRGLLGVGRGRTNEAVTDSNGSVSLLLSAGMTYDLQIEPPRSSGLARKRLTLTAAPATQTLILPRAIIVEGTLNFPSSTGQRGVRVEAYCDGCPTTQEVLMPIAETVTEIGGVFRLYLPDPDEDLL